MNLIVRQVTLGDAEGITNVLNPIIIEGLYTVLDTPFTPEEEKEFITHFPERGVFTVALSEIAHKSLVSKISSPLHNIQKLLTMLA